MSVEYKTEEIKIKVKPTFKDKVSTASREKGETVSEYTREALIDRMKKEGKF